jgi:hypothetical protein
VKARALLLATAVSLLAGCGGSSQYAASTGSGQPAVPRLTSMAQLRADFAAHAAEPQLVVLISPT